MKDFSGLFDRGKFARPSAQTRIFTAVSQPPSRIALKPTLGPSNSRGVEAEAAIKSQTTKKAQRLASVKQIFFK